MHANHCTIRSIIQGIIAHVPLNASHEDHDQNCNETFHFDCELSENSLEQMIGLNSTRKFEN